ncbi:immunoglobulin lambda-1 light chain-like [Mustelus asterias]
MEVVWQTIIFLLCLTAATPNPVLQQPPSASVAAGGTAALSCRVENINVGDYGGSWYRLRKGRQPEWVLVLWASGDIQRGSGITERYLAARDTKSNSYTLNINNMAESDTGSYYCAVYYNNQCYFGNGISLLIPSRQISAPSVHLYPPSAEQLAQAGASVTLSCLAEGFYPGHVRARWTLDEEEAAGGLSAGAAEATRAEDGSYRWSTYLTLPAGQWGSHARYSCQLQHESSQEPIVRTIERESCELR